MTQVNSRHEGDWSTYEILEADGVITAETFLAANHSCFDGHFDQFPIFPGAAQIALVLDLLKWKMGRQVAIKKITRTKFTALLRPDSTVRIQLTLNEGEQSIRWQLSNGDQTYSKGILRYA